MQRDELPAGLDPAGRDELLDDVDPADLAAAFHRVADRLEEVRKASEKRDKALARRGFWNRVLMGILFLIIVALALGGLQIHTNATSTARATSRAAVAASRAYKAQQQGMVLVHKICTTFARLPQPPSGNPRANPSRAALRGVIGTLHELGTDLGCPRQR